MKERPILFSAPMVLALLAGTKTQTRRIVKPQPAGAPLGGKPFDDGARVGNWWFPAGPDQAPFATFEKRCPYGVPGDRLWVREAFSYETLDVDRNGFMAPWYWADGNPTSGDFTKPKPSIHMPRWACRLTLEITDVRVERLQDISYEDCRDEGTICPIHGDVRHVACSGLRDGYRTLWESINGPGSWAANPWVWAVSFQRVTQ